MKIKTIFITLLFAGIYMSCKKEEPVSIANTEAFLLKQVLVDNQPTFEYSYTNTKLISEEKSQFDLEQHHYDGNNLLVSTDLYANLDILSTDAAVSASAMTKNEWVTPVSSNKGGSIKYDYNDKEQLIKVTYSPLSGSSQSSELSYDSNDRINKQVLKWENKETGYIDYSYDTDGNMIEENLYTISSTGAPELSTTTQYEFDNKVNPYRSASRLLTPGITTNTNNIVKVTYTIHLLASMGSDNVQVTKNSYKYNANGYPVSKNGNVTFIYG